MVPPDPKQARKVSYFIDYNKVGKIFVYAAATAGGGIAGDGGGYASSVAYRKHGTGTGPSAGTTVAATPPPPPPVGDQKRPPSFMALYYTKDILSKAGKVIGLAEYDIKMSNITIDQDGMSGQMNGQYTAVHKIKKGSKTIIVRMNGEILQDLSGSKGQPIDHVAPWTNINKSKISNVVASHFVETDNGVETLYSDPKLNLIFVTGKPTMYKIRWLNA